MGQCRGLFSHLKAKIWQHGLHICPEEPQGGGTDLNINDFQYKFAGYGFNRFPNLPAL